MCGGRRGGGGGGRRGGGAEGCSGVLMGADGVLKGADGVLLMRYAQTGVVGRNGFAATLRGIAVDDRDRLYAVGDAEVKVVDARGHLERRWPTSSPGLSVAVDGGGRGYGGEG